MTTENQGETPQPTSPDETQDEQVNQTTQTSETEETEVQSSTTSPSSLEEATQMIADLRKALSKANSESAGRRVQNKEIQARLAALEAEVSKSRENEQRLSAQTSFAQAVKKLGVVFASDIASEDALNYARALVSGTVTMEQAIEQVLKSRPYLAKKIEPVDTDDASRGGNRSLPVNEADIAAAFGIPYRAPKGDK